MFGFFALLLCNVLFLTTVWRYSVLGAGAALTPGPIAAAAVAPVAGRLADRFGQRAIAIPGCLFFAAGSVMFVLDTGPNARYWASFLPAAPAMRSLFEPEALNWPWSLGSPFGRSGGLLVDERDFTAQPGRSP